ncbi:protein mono-ADP-ribosyltransferase PARP14-like isoform X2 [Babylonia areolata]|uniref:protein mono-ADP-ribosyltransferase PARP14-like isoform X2 n=1 Tax=Babylonia areolata TaxID=304850 RepID=UPI003FD3FAE4
MADLHTPRMIQRPKTAGPSYRAARTPLQVQSHEQQPLAATGAGRTVPTGTDRNLRTHSQTPGNSEPSTRGGLCPVGVDDVNLRVTRGARAGVAQTEPASVKPRVVEVTDQKLDEAHVYRYYFQIHKHGGQVERVELDQEKNLVFVTFVRHEDAENIVKHPHMISDRFVQLRLLDGAPTPPSDNYLDKLFFTNVDVTKDKEHLSLYLSAVTHCDPIEDQILYGDTAGEVLVTFKQQPDKDKTAEKCRERHFANRQVSVQAVPKSKCIIVENMNPASTRDGIVNYFENPNKGGAPVEDFQFSPDKKRCFVYFSSSEVAEGIAKKKHTLDDCELRVRVFMECLGQSAGGFDPKDFYFPQPVVFEGDDHLVSDFLREKKKFQSEWSKTFNTKHAKICFGATKQDPIITVSCTLDPRNPKFRLLATEWKQEVDKMIEKMRSAIAIDRVEVKEHSWEDAENYIKGKIKLKKDEAMLICNEAEKVLIVVALVKKIDDILKTLRKDVAKIEKNNMKRKKIESGKMKTPEIRLLDKINFPRSTEQKYNDVKITVNTTKKTLVFEGPIVAIREAEQAMVGVLRNVKNTTVKLQEIQRILLDKDQVCQSIENCLNKQNVIAVWEKAVKDVNIYGLGENADKSAKKVLSRHVAIKTCHLSSESSELVGTDKFKETLDRMVHEHRDRVHIECKPGGSVIMIAGYTAREMKKQVEEYMLENTVYSETVKFSRSRQEIIKTQRKDKLSVIQTELQAYMVVLSCGETDDVIRVKGTSQGLKLVRHKLEELGQQIQCQSEDITQADKIKFLYSKKCERTLKLIIDSSQCVISLADEPAGLQVVESTRPHTPQPEHEDSTSEEDTDEEDEPENDTSDDDEMIDDGDGASHEAVPEKKAEPGKPRKKKRVQEAVRPVRERIRVMKGDITALPVQVDVIVNAANDRLEHAGGLARHIVQKGGRIIQDESDSIMRERKTLQEGDVVPTGPGQLPCKEIFHAVGPRYKGGRNGEKEHLFSVVQNCLQLACERGHKVIAVPAISTGIFKYPVEEASLVIVQAAKEFLEKQQDCSLQTVIFCDTSEDKVGHFCRAEQALFPRNPDLKEAARQNETEGQLTEKSNALPAGKPSSAEKERDASPLINPGPTAQKAVNPPPVPGPQLPATAAATVPHTSVVDVSIVTGELAKQQADVIVNSTGKDLNLSNGAVSKSVLQQAGAELQVEINNNYPNKVNVGDVAITKGYGLQCKHVFHVCLCGYAAQTAAELLYKVTQKCLSEANTRGYTSIAFPALGAGALGYPKDEVAQTMLRAVGQFEQSHPSTSLRKVIFVVFPTDQAALQAFHSVNTQVPSPNASPIVNTHPAVQGPQLPTTAAATVPQTYVVNVSIVTGELAKQQADVIVNSTGKDLNLSNGAVSKSVLQQAGSELQVEINNNYPNKVKFGDVAITKGYGLQCKHVFHVCLCGYAAQTTAELLYQVTHKCLSEANTRGYTSIAFPALGAGALGYPRDVVAQTMLRAVGQFEQSHPSTSLRKVIFVVFPTDQAVLQAFDGVTAVNASPGVNTQKAVNASPGVNTHTAVNASPGVNTQKAVNASPGVNTQTAVSPSHPVPAHTSPDPERPRGFSPNTDAEECELMGIRFVVNQGRKESEPTDAIVEYVDPKHPQRNSDDGVEVLRVNVPANKGDWKKCFSQCLEEAVSKKYMSIALSSPFAEKEQSGTERFAEALFGAVIEVHGQLGSAVQEVNVLFADYRDVRIFMMAMERHGEAYNRCNPTKGPGDALTLAKKPFELSSRTAALPDNVRLFIYATSMEYIRKFREEFETVVKDTFAYAEWKEEQLPRLNRIHMRKIEKLAKLKDVQITTDRNKSTIALCGFKDEVLEVKNGIVKIFYNAMMEKHEEEKIDIFANFAQWSYLQEEQGKQSRAVPFPKAQNSIIEKAFQNKAPMVQIETKKGCKYIIDFNTMMVHPEQNPKDEVPVLRQVKIQDKNEFKFPETWDVQREMVKLVAVPPNSEEFKTVNDNLQATIGDKKVSVLEITRIQNKSLHQQYQATRQRMETQNQDVQNLQNEKLLWHGTAKDATDNINNHGFNRSYCGKNATVHGQGVYFAVNSGYSARKTYSPEDGEGKRYMYQSRVLVGVSCRCDSDTRFLPARSGNTMYDSGCDNIDTPKIYVIFHDTQAYPEYQITFKES